MGRTGSPPPLVARIFAVLLFLAGAASAHNPDTSYARVIITDSALEVRLTFDIFTLQKIVELDTDRDQRVTRAELERAAPAIQQLLRAHVGFELDGQPADLGEPTPPAWPKDAADALAAADWHSVVSLIAFPFRKSVASPPHEVALTFDVFETLGERHTILGVFEHAGETHEVTFTQVEPDYLYDINYAPSSGSPGLSLSASLLRFLKLGIEHIFLGYDHICFLLALIVVSRFGELVKIVTAFTVAHSITLILAALKSSLRQRASSNVHRADHSLRRRRERRPQTSDASLAIDVRVWTDPRIRFRQRTRATRPARFRHRALPALVQCRR
jgi:hypothetical protein